MEDIKTVKELIQPNDYAVSVDLKSAYNHVTVHPSLRPYLGFVFNGNSYVYTSMPFGIKDAPRVFTRIMRSVIWNIREIWKIRCVYYLDDLLFLHQDATELQRIISEILPWMDNLGWTINFQKSELIPKRVFNYLGWCWDSCNMCVQLSTDKRDKVLHSLKCWEKRMIFNKRVPVRDFASLIGVLSATRLQFDRASLYLVKMNRLKCATVNREGWDGKCQLTHMISGELKWWQEAISTNQPASLFPQPQPDIHMWVDASPSGWGAWLQLKDGRYHALGAWDSIVEHQTNNFRELIAVGVAIKLFSQRMLLPSGIHLRVHSDNAAVVFNIQRKAAARNLYHPLRSLFNFCIKNEIVLSAQHVKGVENQTADSLSRLSRSGDYSLKKGVFNEMCSKLHVTPVVDLFATKRNAQLPQYISPLHMDNSEVRDALSIPWGGMTVSVHPPIPVIGKCLRKIMSETASGIVIVPHWKGQSWSTILRKMSRASIILGKSEEILQAGSKMKEKGDKLPPGYLAAHFLSPPYEI
jgi:ribonuclease HI